MGGKKCRQRKENGNAYSTMARDWTSMKQASVWTWPGSFSSVIEHASGISFFLVNIFLMVSMTEDIVCFALMIKQNRGSENRLRSDALECEGMNVMLQQNPSNIYQKICTRGILIFTQSRVTRRGRNYDKLSLHFSLNQRLYFDA